MHIFKKILGFFLSLGTTIWLTLALLCLLLYGSFVMPLREEFLALHSVPLFQWLTENHLGITWWLWCSTAILSVLTLNTIFCSIESVIKKRDAGNRLLVISPQVIHIGFLFILLAHLLSSYGSFKGTAVVSKGSALQLSNGLTVMFDAINMDIDPSGYIREWSAEIKYLRDGRQISSDTISPNNPSFQDGLGIYIKTVQPAPLPAAVIEVSRDPGALWALIGGILFLTGMTTLLLLKIRIEEARS